MASTPKRDNPVSQTKANSSESSPLEEARHALEQREDINEPAVIDELRGKVYAAVVGPDESRREFSDQDVPYNQIKDIFVYDRETEEYRPASEFEEEHIRRYWEEK